MLILIPCIKLDFRIKLSVHMFTFMPIELCYIPISKVRHSICVFSCDL